MTLHGLTLSSYIFLIWISFLLSLASSLIRPDRSERYGCVFHRVLLWTAHNNLVPRAFPLKNGSVGREKALASAGHVHSLNIPEKLIYMQPAGFALTEVEGSNNGK